MANGWEHKPNMIANFPDSWPDSLRNIFQRLSDECTRVSIQVGKKSIRGYPTFDIFGTPHVAGVLYDGVASRVIELASIPDAITSCVKQRDGEIAIYWQFDRDEPIAWIMLQ